MPCRSDYLEATPLEVEYSKILALLHEIGTGRLPSYYGDGYHKFAYQKANQKSVNIATAKLCKALKGVRNVSKYSLEMQIWWRDHQRADEKRRESEAKARTIDSIKKKALAKLSNEEKKVLGL